MKKLSKEQMKKVIGGDGEPDPYDSEDSGGDGGGSGGWCDNPYDEGMPCIFTKGLCNGLRGHCHNRRCVGGC